MVRPSGMEFIAISALFLAILSFTIPKPVEFLEIEGRLGELENCTQSACFFARAEMGAFDEGVRAKAVRQVLAGDAWGALAFLAGNEDKEVRGAFAERIDAEVEAFNLSNAGSERALLIAYEMGKRLAKEPGNALLRAKFEETRGWLIRHPSDTVLYQLVMKGIANNHEIGPSPNARAAVKLASTFENFKSARELFLFPSGEQRELAAQAWEEFARERDPQLLAEDAGVLFYYSAALYPTHLLRPGIPSMIFVYFLPVALVCLIPAITFLTMRGKERQARFQRERAKNMMLAGALLLLLIPILVNGLMLLPLAPYAALFVFFLPPIIALFVYTIASLTLQREYGIIREMTAEVVLERLRRMFWVFAFGALLTMLVVLLATYVQEYTAFLGVPFSRMAVPAFFTMVVLALIPFVPRLLELITGSFEVGDGEMRKGLDGICSKFGYTAESVRVIPSNGSTMTNAFQAGLFGKNVRIFVFQTLLDRKLFTGREFEAVVAHELAHIEKRHVLKTLIGYVCAYLLFMLLFSVALLPFDSGSVVAGALLQLAPYASFLLSLLVTLWIRRQFEREADMRAAELGYGEALLSALKKIYHLNLMPARRPKLLSFFSSHGDLRTRMRELYKATR